MKLINIIRILFLFYAFQCSSSIMNNHFKQCMNCKYMIYQNKCKRFIMLKSSFKRLLNEPSYVIHKDFYPSIIEARNNKNLCGRNASEFKPNI